MSKMLQLLVDGGWLRCPDCDSDEIIQYTRATDFEEVIRCCDCEHEDTFSIRAIMETEDTPSFEGQVTFKGDYDE